MATFEKVTPVTEDEADDIRVTLELDEGEVECEILTIFEANNRDYIALKREKAPATYIFIVMQKTKKDFRRSTLSTMMKNTKSLQTVSMKCSTKMNSIPWRIKNKVYACRYTFAV